LRVIFAGTPAFAATALEALLAAGHEVPLVLTQPDRPSGRGLHVTPSAVADLAARHGIATLKPDSLKQGVATAQLRDAAADVMVVAAYGLILPPDVLCVAKRGCLNIHASLLPRWRGAAPIQRALLAGDTETGVGIMQMDAGLDTGPLLLEMRWPIGARETSGTLTEALARLGAAAIVEALSSIDSLVPRAQDDSGATYATKVAKREARIDWSHSQRAIDRQVRAFNPAPGAETRLNGDVLKIWAAEPVTGRGNPGEVLESDAGRWVIACGDGALAVTRVQRPGGKPMSAADFLRGVRVARGSVLESTPSAA
jgi:methionyl-tRNA formyltransferase